MAGTFGIITGTVIGASGVTLLARILGQNAIPITQASMASITFTVRDLNTAQTIASTQALVVANVIFDSLQSDPRWTQDSQQSPGADGWYGYNFMVELPAADFVSLFDIDPTTNELTPHRVQVGVEFTPANSAYQKFRQPFQFNPLPTWP